MRARTSIGFGSALHKDSVVPSVKFKSPAPTRTLDDNSSHHGIGIYSETVVKSDADSTRFSDSSAFPFVREKTTSLTMTV